MRIRNLKPNRKSPGRFCVPVRTSSCAISSSQILFSRGEGARQRTDTDGRKYVLRHLKSFQILFSRGERGKVQRKTALGSETARSPDCRDSGGFLETWTRRMFRRLRWRAHCQQAGWARLIDTCIVRVGPGRSSSVLPHALGIRNGNTTISHLITRLPLIKASDWVELSIACAVSSSWRNSSPAAAAVHDAQQTEERTREEWNQIQKKKTLSLFVPKKNKENKKTFESVSAEVLQKNVPICLAFLVEWCVELKS